MFIVGCLSDLLKEIKPLKKKAATTSRVETANAQERVKTKEEYKQDYQRFLAFFHENCKVVKGEYDNFDDIYATYIIWDCYSNQEKMLSHSTIGHYLKKATGIKKVTTSMPDQKNRWNNVYLGISLKRQHCKQVRPQYAELYRFRHLALKETGDHSINILMDDLYGEYVRWCEHERTIPYTFGLFSSRLRKFLDKKKVHFERICISGIKLRVLTGAEYNISTL